MIEDEYFCLVPIYLYSVQAPVHGEYLYLYNYRTIASAAVLSQLSGQPLKAFFILYEGETILMGIQMHLNGHLNAFANIVMHFNCRAYDYRVTRCGPSYNSIFI